MFCSYVYIEPVDSDGMIHLKMGKNKINHSLSINQPDIYGSRYL